MAEPIRLLLIDDDEEAYLIVRHLLGQVEGQRYQLDWRSSYEQGLAAMVRQEHDLYLIDYRLDEHDGLDLLRAARERGVRQPLVLLTGIGDRDVDLQAMNAGAADYVCKDELTGALLERSIRYALKHRRLLEVRDRQALKLRLLAAELGRAEERERRRIALLIHDELQQTLVASKMRLGNLRRQLTGETNEEAARVQGLLDGALQTCRNLATGISPPVLHSAGLLAACHWLAGWMRDHYGLQVALELEDHAEPADEHLRTFLFHAVRELLFNVVKHAGTDHARLAVTRADDKHIRVEVQDPGAGFDPRLLTQNDRGLTHFGLFGIRQRVELMSGRMEIEAAPGRGTTINLLIPAQVAASPATDNVSTDRRRESA